MTSAVHRTVPGRRPAGVCTHRTGTGRFMFKIYIVRFQRCPADLLQRRPGTGRCFHIQTPDGARTICDHARENSQKSSGARAIIKFAGDVHIAEIVRCQCYL